MRDEPQTVRNDVPPLRKPKRLRFNVGAAVLVLFAVVSLGMAVLEEWRVARPRVGTDPISHYDRVFSSLAPYLPPDGEVGLVIDVFPRNSVEWTRSLQVAQYALAPRIVIDGVQGPFVIVLQDRLPLTQSDGMRSYAVVGRFSKDLWLYRHR